MDEAAQTDTATDTATATAAVLLVDEDPEVLDAMAGVLESEGHEVLRAGSIGEALALLGRRAPEVVVAEAALPGGRGTDLLRHVRSHCPETVVILMTGSGSIRSAVEAVRRGAYDYLTKPVVDDELRLAVGRALQQQALLAENRRLRSAPATEAFDRIVGQDPRMIKVFELIDAVADSRASVLISGASGTGKSLVARAIHERSRRRAGPFVEVSCGALPETLLESELFGHVRGAFTDASDDRPGKFATADGGTIFLDEISTASPALQAKLLRVLQERRFEPVGSNRTRAVDVRVILATNRDLLAEVEAGRFRRDLYYRVNVVNIELPPLAERGGDVALLAEHFLNRFRRENRKLVAGFTSEALAALRSYAWPGNVRELANCIERAVVLCRGSRIAAGDLPPRVAAAAEAARAGAPGEPDPAVGGVRPLAEALAGPERRIIRDALAAHDGCRKAAAAALSIDRTTLYKKMKKHGLLPSRPRRPGASDSA